MRRRRFKMTVPTMLAVPRQAMKLKALDLQRGGGA
jgi:hypothetical protein